MFSIGLIVLLVVVLVLVPVAVLVLVVVLGLGSRRGARASREWRWVQATRVVGLVLGGVAAWWVVGRGGWGLGASLAPAAFGLVTLVAVALGETVVRPRRPEGVRSASLRPRRVRDYLPPVLGPAVGAVVVALVATLLLATLTASRDEYTDAVRALSCSSAVNGQSHTPYPGSYYSLPLAALLVAVLLVAGLAARQVVRRPRGLGGTVADDDALRRRSLTVVVAATGLAAGATYVGIALMAGGALRGLGSARPTCAAAWMGPTGSVLLLSVLPALVLTAVCLVQLLAGRATLPTRPVDPVRVGGGEER